MKKRRSKKPFLAFSVLEEDEHTGEIVYVRVRNRAEALQRALTIGANREIVDAAAYRDAPDVVVKRERFADRFAPGPCPHSVMVAHGWHFEGEDFHISAETMHERGLPISGIIGAGSSMTFSCAAARDAFLKREATKKRLGDSALDALELRLFDMLPEARPLRENDDRTYGGRRYTYVTRNADGFYHVEEAELPFDFDGRQYGYASIGFRRATRRWRSMAERRESGDAREYDDISNGTPAAPVVMCSNGDVEVFNKWAAAQGSSVRIEERFKL